MPCNSEHMEPTVRERQHRLAAQLLVFVVDSLGDVAPSGLRDAANNIYGGSNGERWMKQLCATIRAMTKDELDRIVYNGRDPMSRKLADWWDEHQREDWKRREAEAKKAKSFDTCLELAKQYDAGGYSMADTAAKVSEVTGMYFDADDTAHIFEFEDGIIILSGMDGITAYKGEPVK